MDFVKNLQVLIPIFTKYIRDPEKELILNEESPQKNFQTKECFLIFRKIYLNKYYQHNFFT